MSTNDHIRDSIFCEHIMNLAQHDHLKKSDTLAPYREAVRQKIPLQDFNRCRRWVLKKALALKAGSKS